MSLSLNPKAKCTCTSDLCMQMNGEIVVNVTSLVTSDIYIERGEREREKERERERERDREREREKEREREREKERKREREKERERERERDPFLRDLSGASCC